VRRGAKAALASLVPVLALFGCREREGVVVYVSADESVARPVLLAFTAETGIPVTPVFDTEATKTTGLANRLRAERDRPRADLFWSSEIAFTVALAEEGVLAPRAADPPLDWPASLRDPQDRWFAFAPRARVIVVPESMPADERPVTWMDLTDEKWRGRIAMADPRFGTTRTHLGAMRWWWEREVMPGYFDAWAEGLAENGVKLLTSGNAGVVDAVARGEALVGLTDTDDVFAARERGEREKGFAVELVYPRHAPDPRVPAGGTLLIPNTVAIVAGTSRPAEAGRLLEFLLSEDVESMLFESASRNVPLRLALDEAAKAAFVPPEPIEIDWATASGGSDAAVRSFLDRVGSIAGNGEAAVAP
jgi:iron(III) transport system substrate-binding protein